MISLFSQIIANTLITAAIYALIALGFALVYGTARFFHFAHGIVIAAGAYLVLFFHEHLSFPMPIAIFSAVLGGTALGCAMEFSIYRPLRRRRSSPLVLLLASLGLYVVLQNVLSLHFGDMPRSIPGMASVGSLSLLGAHITPIQLFSVIASILFLIAVALFWKFTRIGKACRAVANNQSLAATTGISPPSIFLWSFGTGSALAAIAGLLIAMDTCMTPNMGLFALVMGVVVMIIGGVESVLGIVLGALLLSSTQHVGAYFIGAQWQDAIAFAVLLVFLVFRPEGFLGKRLKSAAV